MNLRALHVMLAAGALLVAGCGAAVQAPPKAADDSYDWSTYNGAFAPGGPGTKSPEPSGEAAKSDSTDTPETADGDAGKRTSKKKIRGESLSSVSPDVVAGALKAKVVSTNLVVGPEYEQLQVVLKGAAVQIVRPAANPDMQGPKIRSPKARNDDLAKTDAAWYDRDADVLVLVQAKKKATSRRVLHALLKR